MKNGWAQEDPRVILAVVVGILVTVCWIVRTHRKKKRREQEKKAAIEAGRVIKARRMKISEDIDETDTGTREYTYRGVYEYEVDGQTKRHRVISKRTLPYVFLYLYYTDTPKKVFSDYDNLETGYSTACLLGIGALLLTMYLTGYITF